MRAVTRVLSTVTTVAPLKARAQPDLHWMPLCDALTKQRRYYNIILWEAEHSPPEMSTSEPQRPVNVFLYMANKGF